MAMEIRWCEVDASSFIARLSVTTENNHQRSSPSHSLIEAFTSCPFHITVVLDAVPIRSFSVYVRALNSNSHIQPSRLHFGSSFSNEMHQWHQPQDILFEQTNSSQPCFTALHSFDTAFPSSISFVIQCTNSQWIRSQSGGDFHVGVVNSSEPNCVELPFLLPPGYPDLPDSPVKILSLHRNNPFWLVPHFPSSITGCKDETFFVLVELHKSVDQLPRYCAILFCIDPISGLRSSLFSIPSTCSPAIRLESGLNYPLSMFSLRKSLVAAASYDKNPFLAIRSLIHLISSQGVEVSSTFDKLSSPFWPKISSSSTNPLLNSVGFCTWDAFDQRVSKSLLQNAVNWFRESQIKIGYVIVDDGWQSVDETDNDFERPVLTDFTANDKFSGSLDAMFEESKLPIYAWTTLFGYWGGVSPFLDGVRTVSTTGKITRGLLRNNAEDLTFWEKTYKIPYPERDNLTSFFSTYFLQSLSRKHKISGLKVDAQSLLSLACTYKDLENDKEMTWYEVMKRFRSSLAEVSAIAFPNTALMNCMACGPETIFTSGKTLTSSNICWRTSNDHAFPGVKEDASAVVWHIISNAMNTVLLGEIFPIPDWDMFRIADDYQLSKLHAVARVISGGPVYISDTPPFKDEHMASASQVLKSLVTDNGHLIRCCDVGRPTADCLFHANHDKLFKVFNRNTVNAIIAIFNTNERKSVTGSFQPSDILDFDMFGSTHERYLSFVVYDGHKEAYLHASKLDSCTVEIGTLQTAVAHVCPVLNIQPGLELSVIGQPSFINCGGSVSSLSISYNTDALRVETVVQITFLGSGNAFLWMRMEIEEEKVLIQTTTGSMRLNSLMQVLVNDVSFFVVEVPKQLPNCVWLQI